MQETNYDTCHCPAVCFKGCVALPYIIGVRTPVLFLGGGYRLLLVCEFFPLIEIMYFNCQLIVLCAYNNSRASGIIAVDRTRNYSQMSKKTKYRRFYKPAIFMDSAFLVDDSLEMLRGGG